jgi:hypothetical protein
MIEQLIAEYVDFTLQTKNDPILDVNVKSDIMQKMAGALAHLVPLVTNDGQAELQMKQQEHAMTLEMKQQEMAMKQQEHEMKLQQSQADHQLKLRQSQINHTNTLVQSQQSHETKLKQAQAGGAKNGSNNPVQKR